MKRIMSYVAGALLIACGVITALDTLGVTTVGNDAFKLLSAFAAVTCGITVISRNVENK